MEQHNNIINVAAKNCLAPEGLFRKGNSRCWIDDNDWFMIQVEFQPSAYGQGSYLNVGIDFLWERTKELNEVLAFAYGGRMSVNGTQFAAYAPGAKNGHADFTAEMEAYAAAALEKVTEYRRFRDLDHAKRILMQKAEQVSEKCLTWDVYNLSMLCFFKRDFEEGKEYFCKFLNILKNSFCHGAHYIEWHEDYYNYCQKEICPQIVSAESAQRMVFDMINRRRAFFNSKTSYKKMKKDIMF